jgi:hypothetical protein
MSNIPARHAESASTSSSRRNGKGGDGKTGRVARHQVRIKASLSPSGRPPNGLARADPACRYADGGRGCLWCAYHDEVRTAVQWVSTSSKREVIARSRGCRAAYESVSRYAVTSTAMRLHRRLMRRLTTRAAALVVSGAAALAIVSCGPTEYCTTTALGGTHTNPVTHEAVPNVITHCTTTPDIHPPEKP